MYRQNTSLVKAQIHRFFQIFGPVSRPAIRKETEPVRVETDSSATGMLGGFDNELPLFLKEGDVVELKESCLTEETHTLGVEGCRETDVGIEFHCQARSLSPCNK